MFKRKLFGDIVLTASLGGLALFFGVSPARADSYRSCQEKLGNAQEKLDRSIARHGRFSWEARHDRDRLENARSWCDAHDAYGYGRGDRDRYRDRDDGYYR